MVALTINILDPSLTRAVDALCADAGLPATNANAKQAIINHVVSITRNYEAEKARINAVAAIIDPTIT